MIINRGAAEVDNHISRDDIFDFHPINYVIKVDDVKLNTKQRHLNGDTAQDAVLLQNRKFRQIRSNLVSACSSRSN